MWSGQAQRTVLNRGEVSAYIDILFLYVFTKCDKMFIAFSIGKKMGFKSIVKKEKGIKDWLKGYCSPK